MKPCYKYYKFDLEVKDKGHTGDLNVRDTSSYSDTQICKIWYANVKAKLSYILYLYRI